VPPTRMEYLKRRCRQADINLRRAQKYLATIYKTIYLQHPELTPVLLALIGQIDGCRRSIFIYYRDIWGGTRRDLWKPGDVDIIIEEAEPVPDPHYK